MSWDDEVREIRARRAYALEQGGEAGISRQHNYGKLTVRERIDQLLDEGSFREHGRMAGAAYLDDDGAVESFTPANYVVGLGTVNERRVAIGGEDFTLKGGSPNAAGLRPLWFSIAPEYRACRIFWYGVREPGFRLFWRIR